MHAEGGNVAVVGGDIVKGGPGEDTAKVGLEVSKVVVEGGAEVAGVFRLLRRGVPVAFAHQTGS